MPQTANPTPRQGLTIRVKKMKPHDLKSMSVDELWSFHELVASVLARWRAGCRPSSLRSVEYADTRNDALNILMRGADKDKAAA